MLLTLLIEGFRTEVSRDPLIFDAPAQKGVNWLHLLLEIAMYVLIIYGAKPMAQWFSSKFNDEDDSFSFEDDRPVKPVSPYKEDEP